MLNDIIVPFLVGVRKKVENLIFFMFNILKNNFPGVLYKINWTWDKPGVKLNQHFYKRVEDL
jgi:hypothetical protein